MHSSTYASPLKTGVMHAHQGLGHGATRRGGCGAGGTAARPDPVTRPGGAGAGRDHATTIGGIAVRVPALDRPNGLVAPPRSRAL